MYGRVEFVQRMPNRFAQTLLFCWSVIAYMTNLWGVVWVARWLSSNVRLWFLREGYDLEDCFSSSTCSYTSATWSAYHHSS